MGPLDQLVGQAALKEYVSREVLLSSEQGTRFPNVLLVGPPESGKSTLALAIAETLGHAQVVDASTTSFLDFSGVISVATDRSIIVVEHLDQISHAAFRRAVSEYVSDSALSIVIGTGPGARTHRIPVPTCPVIATAETSWNIEKSLLRWFVLKDLATYSSEETADMVEQFSATASFGIEREAALE